MIKFELPDGTRGRVVFQHDRGTFPESATGTAGTDCRLELLAPTGDLWLARGSSTLHPGDKFDKEIGRKVSLARALAYSGLGRADRALVWQAYRGRRLKSVLAQFQAERRKEQELDSALQQEWDEGHPSCGCRKVRPPGAPGAAVSDTPEGWACTGPLIQLLSTPHSDCDCMSCRPWTS